MPNHQNLQKSPRPDFDGFEGGGYGHSKIHVFFPPARGADRLPYTEKKQSDYDCQTCGLNDITEDVARRVQ
jgi:hypothetical protein